MGRGRRKFPHKVSETPQLGGGVSGNLEPGCSVVSLRRFPAELKRRIGMLQAKRKVAGVEGETLETLHALVAELGCERLEAELGPLGVAGLAVPMDERESNP